MYIRFLSLLTILFAAAVAASAQGNAVMGFRATAGVGAVTVSASGGALTPAAIRSLEQEAFQLINARRDNAGMEPLQWSDKVAAVARLHSSNMAELNFFSHQGLDGLMVSQRAERLNMGRWSAIGENIAFMKGYENPQQRVVEKWMDSPGHKRNLLNPDWTEAAIGLSVTPDGKYYFTQVFIRN
jgi:uncharacterized protein YkwD